MSGRIDSVYPIIKGAELTPLAAHFGRDPPTEKEGRKMGGEEEWTPPKEREREKGGDLSVGKLMTEMLLQRPAKNAPGCVNAAGKQGQK